MTRAATLRAHRPRLRRARVSNLGGLPARAALRRLLGLWLARAQAAVTRLGAGRDGEALHDFRVALRRLRTAARAYGEVAAELVPDKPRRKLKRLVAATNATRDAEVFAAWLQAQRETLPGGARSGAHWLQARLARQLRADYARLRAELPGAYARQARKLTRVLETAANAASDSGPSFARLSAVALGPLLEAYAGARAALADPPSSAQLHALRLAIKRLRYVIEPLAGELPDGKALRRQLTAWQDLLGEIHDRARFGELLAEAAAEAGAQKLRRDVLAPLAPGARRRGADPSSGLILLAQRLAAENAQRRAKLAQALAGGELAALQQALETMQTALLDAVPAA